jgi:hypothetical protein
VLPTRQGRPRGRRAGTPRVGVWIAALAMLAAHEARALDVAVLATRENGGWVWTDVQLGDVFEPRVAESLTRGMPATLRLHAELWRRRTAWFDRMESSFDADLRIRFDVWTRAYRLERRGAPEFGAASLDSIAAALTRPIAMRVGRVGQLEPGARYYLVVVATLKPLSVEDVEAIEGWLSGEVQGKRAAGFGIITELPRSVFDAVRNFAGFGDLKARAISPDFELRTLFPAEPPASGQ